jgi:hypothetical protein
VSKSLKDQIPKCLMHLMVNSFKEFNKNELLACLYANDDKNKNKKFEPHCMLKNSFPLSQLPGLQDGRADGREPGRGPAPR